MKFTSEDLMKAMGLKVGDRVKMPFGMDEAVCKLNDNYQLCFEDVDNYLTLENLLNKEYEILPQPKRVGDLNIDDKYIYYKYKLVPLLDFKSNVCWGNGVPEPKNLYEVLEHWQKYNKDQEIYDILKARLDKVVKDNE